MGLCAELILSTLSTKRCKVPGGLGTEFYLADLDDIESYTADATSKAIETLVMKTGKSLHKVVGVVNQNTAGTAVTGGENYPDYKQSFTLKAYYSTQLEKNDLENIVNHESLVVVYPTLAGQWKIAGVTKDSTQLSLSSGLKMETADFPEGLTGQDSTAATIVLSGTLVNGTVVFDVGTFATSKTYLEAALTPAA
jgi:hypothetical protein